MNLKLELVSNSLARPRKLKTAKFNPRNSELNLTLPAKTKNIWKGKHDRRRSARNEGVAFSIPTENK